MFFKKLTPGIILEEKNFFYIALILLLSIMLRGLFIPIMEIDAAQYASISMEMLMRYDFLHIYDQNQDYLDKPPMLFWLSALSLKIFGINSFAYKLPSLLISLGGVYGLFQLSKRLYNDQIARTSALVYMSSLSFILMNNDIRTDNILTGFIILSVWQLYLFFETNTWKSFLLSSTFISLAMMSKGPIGIVAPFMCIIPHYIFTGKTQVLYNPRLLIMPFLVLILLTPMLYGLYTQYDLHPEKEVYGLKGPSGIRFYFWDQSFGRITGESQWANQTGPLFFLHTILWSFLPYTFILADAVFSFSRNFRKRKEYLSFFGLLLPIAALSLSRYKLPHYIYIVIPFASILAAQFIHDIGKKKIHVWSLNLMGMIFIFIGCFLIYSFPPGLLFLFIFALVVLTYLLALLSKNKKKIIHYGILSSIIMAITLNFHFYPNLLKFQAGSEIAFDIRQNDLDKRELCFINTNNRITGFYLNRLISECENTNTPGSLVITTQEGVEKLKNIQQACKTLKEYQNISVTKLKFKFLLPHKRQEIVEKIFLLQIE